MTISRRCQVAHSLRRHTDAWAPYLLLSVIAVAVLVASFVVKPPDYLRGTAAPDAVEHYLLEVGAALGAIE